jgi:hypothetical protein
MEDLLSPDFQRYNPCFHIKFSQPFDGHEYTTVSTGSNTFARSVCPMTAAQSLFTPMLSQAILQSGISLSFQDNNDFELLNLVAELDDLIATFTKKFWENLTYGSVNWGILPLLSDLESLYHSFSDIFRGGFISSIEDFNSKTFHRSKFRVEGYSNIYGCDYIFDGTLRMRGSFSTSLPENSLGLLQVFLDELGVHPDLRTVWDLVPYSFVVDYLLPIGDLLESLHPRGWFVPKFHFNGSASLVGSMDLISVPSDPNKRGKRLRATCSCYNRRPSITSSFIVDNAYKVSDYKFGLSLRQLFNIGYLTKDFVKDLL